MSIFLQGTNILLNDEKIATHQDCCCAGGVEPCDVWLDFLAAAGWYDGVVLDPGPATLTLSGFPDVECGASGTYSLGGRFTAADWITDTGGQCEDTRLRVGAGGCGAEIIEAAYQVGQFNAPMTKTLLTAPWTVSDINSVLRSGPITVLDTLHPGAKGVFTFP
jgi:hypothetical protein